MNHSQVYWRFSIDHSSINKKLIKMDYLLKEIISSFVFHNLYSISIKTIDIKKTLLLTGAFEFGRSGVSQIKQPIDIKQYIYWNLFFNAIFTILKLFQWHNSFSDVRFQLYKTSFEIYEHVLAHKLPVKWV